MTIDWSEYRRVHADRRNLLIHLFAVPLFAVSFLSLLYFLSRGHGTTVIACLLAAVVALALQGRGHKFEHEPPRPFTGPGNFLRRWFSEQFYIFPLFVFSGRWWQQYRGSGRLDTDES